MKRPFMLMLSSTWLWLIASPLLPSATAQQAQVQDEKDIQALIEDAREHLMDDDAEGALGHLEELLADHPEHAEALMLAAQAYFVKGVAMAETDRKAANEPLRKGAELMRKFAQLKQQLDPMEKQMVMLGIYNEACCEAVDGQHDKAIELLTETVDMGYDDVDQIKQDPDFAGLREDPRFVAILERARQSQSQDQPEAEDEER